MIPATLKSLVPLSWRQAYWSLPANRAANKKHFARDRRVLGRRAATYLRLSTYAPRHLLSIHLPGYAHPLYFRPRSSDVAVIRQVFAEEEYGAVAGLNDVNLIVDCGANIGCVALYFLHKYPAARVVVVEPDAGNMALCRMNLRPFADRVSFIESGVWSSSCPLKVERGRYRDGQYWSFQVRPCEGKRISGCPGGHDERAHCGRRWRAG